MQERLCVDWKERIGLALPVRQGVEMIGHVGSAMQDRKCDARHALERNCVALQAEQ